MDYLGNLTGTIGTKIVTKIQEMKELLSTSSIEETIEKRFICQKKVKYKTFLPQNIQEICESMKNWNIIIIIIEAGVEESLLKVAENTSNKS